MLENLSLVSPWINFYREIEALFESDPDVKTEFVDDDEKLIILRVEGTDKAEALTRILPVEKTFGNITVKVMVIPANAPDEWDTLTVFEKAFKNNEAFFDTTEKVTPFGTFKYVLFRPFVVQYPNDDIGDANQVRSTLYQDIAKEVFENVPDVHFCTLKLPRTKLAMTRYNHNDF